MNTKTFFSIFNATVWHLRQLTYTKGEEYVGAQQDDQLRNFKETAQRTSVTPLQALYVALDKHLHSISTYVKESTEPTQRTLSEPIHGRIDDAILYLILMKCLIADQGLSGGPQVYQQADEAEQAVAKLAAQGNDRPEHPYEQYCTPDHAGRAVLDPIKFAKAFEGIISARPNEVDNSAQILGNYFEARSLTPGIAVRVKGGDALETLVDRSQDSFLHFQDSVVEWATATFGQRSLEVIERKLCNEEIPELVLALGRGKPEQVGGEFADVMILIADYARLSGIDLMGESWKKLAKNRVRDWEIDSRGVSRHV